MEHSTTRRDTAYGVPEFYLEGSLGLTIGALFCARAIATNSFGRNPTILATIPELCAQFRNCDRNLANCDSNSEIARAISKLPPTFKNISQPCQVSLVSGVIPMGSSF
jgi:hypothetical protein